MSLEISLLAALLVVRSTLCLTAPAAGKWVLPTFAHRLYGTITNPGTIGVKTLVTLPVVSLQQVALWFPGTLATAVVKNAPGSRYSQTAIPPGGRPGRRRHGGRVRVPAFTKAS